MKENHPFMAGLIDVMHFFRQERIGSEPFEKYGLAI